MLTLEEYKALVRDRLVDLSEAQIKALYERDTTFAAFAIKTWLAKRRQERQQRGRVES